MIWRVGRKCWSVAATTCAVLVYRYVRNLVGLEVLVMHDGNDVHVKGIMLYLSKTLGYVSHGYVVCIAPTVGLSCE